MCKLIIFYIEPETKEFLVEVNPLNVLHASKIIIKYK